MAASGFIKEIEKNSTIGMLSGIIHMMTGTMYLHRIMESGLM
jgi:hypothetical protein